MSSKKNDSELLKHIEKTGSEPVQEEKVRGWLQTLEQGGLPKKKVKVVARESKTNLQELLESDDDNKTPMEKAAKDSPPWLFSITFHLLLLILLALILASDAYDFDSVINVTFSETEGEQLDLVVSQFDDLEQVNLDDTDISLEPTVSANILAPVATIDPGSLMSSTSLSSASLLDGRLTKGRRDGLLKKYGGTKATEEAVQNGLAWLAKNRIVDQDGSYWSLRGPYADGGGTENKTAATAMALIAFQGNGHTHKSRSQYSKLVEETWDWMLMQQDSEGAFGTKENSGHGHRFYTHALSTIALCEILGMTGDKRFREPANRAVQYFVDNQAPQGGWRYTPKDDSDLSVTGWCVIALKSAQMAKVEVPSETLENISKFLETVAIDGGSQYSYTPRMTARPSMTAEGLLSRQFLGWDYKHPKLNEGAAWLTRNENLISYSEGKRDSYYWYYATQVTHHMGGRFWKKWNEVMRDEVPKAQIRDKKHSEFGSWNPKEPIQESGTNMWSTGGRLYITCLSIYMLEVYYRHLPIYKEAVVR